MVDLSALRIAQDLIRIKTINPPGNEASAVTYLASLLEVGGFAVATHSLTERRASLIAVRDGTDDGPPLCFTGHLDTVPLGSAPWSFDAFSGDVGDGKLYGRGASDMKGGVAAIVAAALRGGPCRKQGLKLVFTAGEETGCEGALHLARSKALGPASGIVVAEPTSNELLLGHRGALWLKLCVAGRAAHGSTPERGDNAVIKAAQIVMRLQDYSFGVAPHGQLGIPSLNVGYCCGGANLNMVPDSAEIGVDIRTVPGVDHARVRNDFSRLATGVTISSLLDLPPVCTPADDPWLMRVSGVASDVLGKAVSPKAAPYFTDASVLAPNSGNPPVVVLGPGAIEQAHSVDEHCEISNIEAATEIFSSLMHA